MVISNMKKTLQIIIYLFILTIILFPISSIVYAQTTSDYVVLAPLPGIGDSAGGTTNLTSYLPAAFNLAIGIAAVMAFVMITWGGIVYATSDAVTSKAQGREWIENALWGLLLVIGAWVILYTLNPQILNFNLLLPTPNIQSTGGITLNGEATVGDSGSGNKLADWTPTPAELTTNTQMVAKFKQNGVLVSSSNGGNSPCSGTHTNCTTVVGLPPAAANGVVALKQACTACNGSGDVTITGGTEGGHVSHGPNQPVIDLADTTNLDNWIYANQKSDTMSTNPPGYHIYTVVVNGQTISLMHESAGGLHWHVTFH